MKICMVTSAALPPQEGIGHYVWNLSRYLVRQGHSVQIITRGQRGKPLYEVLQDIAVWRPRFYPVYPLHVHLHGFFVRRLVRRIEAEVDVFHLHTPLPPPISSSRPLLLTVHTPMLGEAGAIPISDFRSLIIRLQIPFSARIERRLFDSAQAIVTVSQSVADELRMYGVMDERVRVLGNGVDTTIFCPDELLSTRKSSERYLVAAGRLDVRKGMSDLVSAMARIHQVHPDVKLYIAGTGPLAAQLQAQIHQAGLENTVALLGQVSHVRMLALYRGATAFVHAAHYEGLPTVLLEAMACGKAVVSTAVSGALDVLQDGRNGLLVPPQEPEKLADTMNSLLNDQPLIHQLGTAALQTIQERFSWQVVGGNYERCYTALSGERAG